jgi:hypothetical protein
LDSNAINVQPAPILSPLSSVKIGAGWTLIALLSKDALDDAENTKEQLLATDEHTTVQ